jgi:hypothetical protein
MFVSHELSAPAATDPPDERLFITPAPDVNPRHAQSGQHRVGLEPLSLPFFRV